MLGSKVRFETPPPPRLVAEGVEQGRLEPPDGVRPREQVVAQLGRIDDGTLRVRDGAEGLVLTPYPGGQKRETFKLTSSEASKAVFECPEKDFPTRIEYHRKEKDRLVITLSGGADKTETFDLRRVAD